MSPRDPDAGRMVPIDALTFELGLRELESIVSRLERGEVGEEAATALYERGEILKGMLQKKLQKAEDRLDAMYRATPAQSPELMAGDQVEWDVFISHASEDKVLFVRPLAEHLRKLGLRVWFDEFTLVMGDGLRRSIDLGLSNSRFGVVVISPNFLSKEWPQKELDGLVAREIDGTKVVLPIWHNVGANEIRARSPMLADRIAVTSDYGIEEVSRRILAAIRPDPQSRIGAGKAARSGSPAKAQQTPVRLSVATSAWAPAGLRLDLRYVSGFEHVGIVAQTTLLSPAGALLKEGRPVTNPARMASGGYTRYEAADPFVDGSGTIKLRALADESQLVVGGVLFVDPAPGTDTPLSMARIRIEILTDTMVTLALDEFAVSPFG
jgi:exodeoxyribonuclease VII small subunit